MNQHPYSVEITYQSKSKHWPAFRGWLLEGDVRIASIRRSATVDGYIPPILISFRSTQARARFDDFADCLTIEESVEALLPL